MFIVMLLFCSVPVSIPVYFVQCASYLCCSRVNSVAAHE